MATTKPSTGTRKASTSRATGSTSTSTSKSDTDPDATTPDAGETGGDTATSSDSTEQDTATAGGSQAETGDDPAAALKKKIRTTQHVENPRPDELTAEQRANLAGPPVGAVGGPRTLASMSSPISGNAEYVHAETEGHIAFVPKRQKQSSTKRVWVAGQHVRKDTYEALVGFVAPTPAEARVLTDEEYAQVAPHL